MTNKHFSGASWSLALVLLIFVSTSVASAQWNEQVLYSFQGGDDGNSPIGGLVFDAAGNLYGATFEGGAYQCGTVYQLSPPEQPGDPWTEAVIYTFRCKAFNDGVYPEGGLVIDAAGNLYGTTGYGGAGNCVLVGALMGCGMVYELSPPAQKGEAWTETILYSFPTDAKEGYVPWGDLVFDPKGNLYGATYFGGGYGTSCNPFYQYCGAVFELSPPMQKGGAWTEKVLHGFQGTSAGSVAGDGEYPNGGLIIDNEGNLYGTTYQGGTGLASCSTGDGQTGCGTVFEMSPLKDPEGAWTEKVLYRFDAEDGANPAAAVVSDQLGNLYGTTYSGGANNACGLVFELRKPHEEFQLWAEAALGSFNCRTNGEYPDGGVAFDGTGALYGTTIGSPHGEVFRLAVPSSSSSMTAVNVLYEFEDAPDGGHPDGPLVFDKTGNIYGITQWGGTGQDCDYGGCGTVYEVSP
jgi:uncharacterized repeat protein (TIGR03803 family)